MSSPFITRKGMSFISRSSEGTHAKYHYMIAGVQGQSIGTDYYPLCSLSAGDFTKSLVNDPPRTLWTRQVKVYRLLVFMIAQH